MIQTKINSSRACIAYKYGIAIVDIPIRRYSIYGKMFDPATLFKSVNRKTKSFINSITADKRKVYFCIEHKADLYNTNTKTFPIKISFKGCDRWYIIYIYQNSPMLEYLRDSCVNLRNELEWDKPCEKIWNIAHVINHEDVEQTRKANLNNKRHELGLRSDCLTRTYSNMIYK